MHDRFQHTLKIFHHIIVPEPDDPIAMLLDHPGPRRVFSLIMLPAIEFHNQTETPRGKVGDIRANGKLFDKFGVFNLPVTQAAPELAFRLGRIAAESASSVSFPSPMIAPFFPFSREAEGYRALSL